MYLLWVVSVPVVGINADIAVVVVVVAVAVVVVVVVVAWESWESFFSISSIFSVLAGFLALSPSLISPCSSTFSMFLHRASTSIFSWSPTAVSPP